MSVTCFQSRCSESVQRSTQLVLCGLLLSEPRTVSFVSISEFVLYIQAFIVRDGLNGGVLVFVDACGLGQVDWMIGHCLRRLMYVRQGQNRGVASIGWLTLTLQTRKADTPPGVQNHIALGYGIVVRSLFTEQKNGNSCRNKAIKRQHNRTSAARRSQDFAQGQVTEHSFGYCRRGQIRFRRISFTGTSMKVKVEVAK